MINYFTYTSPHFVDIAALIARFFIGACFILHGLGKLGVIGTGNMEGFTAWLHSLGLPIARQQARLALLMEIGGGACILLGFFTRIGLVMCFFMMLMAIRLGHRKAGYLITNTPPGWEYAFNLAIICVVMFLLGPGPYSIDALIF
jgi:putative oxidoreductase